MHTYRELIHVFILLVFMSMNLYFDINAIFHEMQAKMKRILKNESLGRSWTQFGYKLSCSQWLQCHSISFY